jgi:hypothetical protein
MQAQNPKSPKEQKEAKKLGRDRLERVIDMMRGIEAHTVDPFLLNVDEIIRIVQEYFPAWDQPEELNLDSEAIHHLASVIKLQSEWVKQRSTSLYTDPFLLEEKIIQKDKQEMVQLFLNAWHPIVEQEQITLRAMADAMRYWNVLVPIRERWEQTAVTEVATGVASRGELVDQNVLRDEAFSAELDRFWTELKEKAETESKEGKLLYMDWVGAETYEQTVHRAYITSFLVTYGYATLEVIPLEEEIYILPREEPAAKLNMQAVSVPVTLTFESWQKWKRGESS